jgi:rhamnulokinase
LSVSGTGTHAESLHAAIDLGAGSGRVLAGAVGSHGLRLTEAHRFHYAARQVDGHLRWNVSALFDGVRAGLRRAAEVGASWNLPIASVGVDSWGVDYGLTDADGGLVEEPICYRDERTDGAMAQVFAIVPRDEIFRRTGLQFLQLNTLFQLWTHVQTGLPPRARHLLLIPDLCHHLLCGSLVSERTDASTTQLLGAASGQWDDWLIGRLGLPRSLMPEVVATGAVLGNLRADLCCELGIGPARVIAPGTHDTASAVAGTPLQPGWAYISSGTWSLVGVERQAPVLSPEALQANLTNEAGVFGSVRLLKNVMGMWLLESCRHEWDAAGESWDLSSLIGAVGRVEGFPGFICPDDPRFFNPPSMRTAILDALRETDQQCGDDPVLLAKVILDSLAFRYASVVTALEDVTGDRVPGIHIVGGGSLNDYLNQATADASGREVMAGPVEATATGNLLAQAIACGTIGSLAEGRRLVAAAQPPRRFTPRDSDRWARAAETYRRLAAASA